MKKCLGWFLLLGLAACTQSHQDLIEAKVYFKKPQKLESSFWNPFSLTAGDLSCFGLGVSASDISTNLPSTVDTLATSCLNMGRMSAFYSATIASSTGITVPVTRGLQRTFSLFGLYGLSAASCNQKTLDQIPTLSDKSLYKVATDTKDILKPTVLLLSNQMTAATADDVLRCLCSHPQQFGSVTDFMHLGNYTQNVPNFVAIHPTNPRILVSAGYAKMTGGSTKVWIARLSQDGGGTWTTVDAYSKNIAYDSAAQSAVIASDGTLYVAGIGKDVSGGFWTVRKSTDSGTTWSTVRSNQFQPGYDSIAKTMAIGSTGNVYAAGTAGSSTAYLWRIEYSSDAGSTWTSVDINSQIANPNNGVNVILVDASENIAVIGTEAASTQSIWRVYRLKTGFTFTTVGNWENIGSVGNMAYRSEAYAAVFSGNNSDILVGGQLFDNTGNSFWHIVGFADPFGLTPGMSLLETIETISGGESFATPKTGLHQMIRDQAGNIYALGITRTPTSGAVDNTLLIRKSSNLGNAWSTFYTSSLATGNYKRVSGALLSSQQIVLNFGVNDGTDDLWKLQDYCE